MIVIDSAKCVGCGSCVKDCFPGVIELKEGKAVTVSDRCMECGHCIAVCPTDAVILEGYDMSEVLDCRTVNCHIEPETYLNHLKARRSIRRFLPDAVSREDIEKIIEAGRYSPTGGNLQNVAYYVASDGLPEIRDMIYEELKRMGQEAGAAGGSHAWYGKMWLDMYDSYHSGIDDKLFFNAGTVIFVSAGTPQAGIIAAAHMETLIYSLGLGMLYSGFTARAVEHSQDIQKQLSLKEGYSVYAVLVIGHPDVRYLKTVPRKPADVIWK